MPPFEHQATAILCAGRDSILVRISPLVSYSSLFAVQDLAAYDHQHRCSTNFQHRRIAACHRSRTMQQSGSDRPSICRAGTCFSDFAEIADGDRFSQAIASPKQMQRSGASRCSLHRGAPSYFLRFKNSSIAFRISHDTGTSSRTEIFSSFSTCSGLRRTAVSFFLT